MENRLKKSRINREKCPPPRTKPLIAPPPPSPQEWIVSCQGHNKVKKEAVRKVPRSGGGHERRKRCFLPPPPFQNEKGGGGGGGGGGEKKKLIEESQRRKCRHLKFRGPSFLIFFYLLLFVNKNREGKSRKEIARGGGKATVSPLSLSHSWGERDRQMYSSTTVELG